MKNSRERSLRTATTNSRNKGKRGERQWRDELRANGYPARRGQQFSGSPDSPDVICDALPWAHFEVKFVEHLNFSAAMAQARRDAGGKAAFLAHRRNHRPWLVTMDADRFYRFLGRDLTGEWATRMTAGSPAAACGEFAWLHCAIRTGRRLNIHEAIAQVRREAGRRVFIVAHQDRDGRWLVTITAGTFFNFLRGELPPEEQGEHRTSNIQLPTSNEGKEGGGAPRRGRAESVPVQAPAKPLETANFGKAFGEPPNVARESRALPGKQPTEQPKQTEQ